MTTTIHDQIILSSQWTLTAVQPDGRCSLLMIDISEERTRQELAHRFAEICDEHGGVAGHATCLADPEEVIVFGTDQAAIEEHVSFLQSMRAKTRKGASRGFGK